MHAPSQFTDQAVLQLQPAAAVRKASPKLSDPSSKTENWGWEDRLPFFDWVVYFSGIELQELLYIFEINSLSVASFAIIFSHSEGCFFTLLIVSFAFNFS